MEILRILEDKVACLIESKKKDVATIRALREEVAALAKENETLQLNLKRVEDSLLSQDKAHSEHDQERQEARKALDDLVRDIDELLGESEL